VKETAQASLRGRWSVESPDASETNGPVEDVERVEESNASRIFRSSFLATISAALPFGHLM
jgi:hypothetical protein